MLVKGMKGAVMKTLIPIVGLVLASSAQAQTQPGVVGFDNLWNQQQQQRNADQLQLNSQQNQQYISNSSQAYIEARRQPDPARSLPSEPVATPKSKCFAKKAAPAQKSKIVCPTAP
jgi:hypothetical protein